MIETKTKPFLPAFNELLTMVEDFSWHGSFETLGNMFKNIPFSDAIFYQLHHKFIGLVLFSENPPMPFELLRLFF